MLLLMSLALARPAVEPPPEKVEVVADGLRFFRKGDSAEGGDEPPPEVNSSSAQDAWSKRLRRQDDRRADLKAADALLADYAPLVADCATKAGVQPGAAAVATITFAASSSQLSVALGKPSEAALGGCLVSTLHKRQVGGLFHPVGGLEEGGGSNPTINPTWTFTYTGPPAEAPAHAVDVERGLGGVRFGTDPNEMAGASLVLTTRSVGTWQRYIDDNVRYMGVKCTVLFLSHSDTGIVGARVRVTGDGDSFRVKEALKSRFGAGKYDSAYKAWYWRGDRLVVVAQRVPDSDVEEFVMLEMGPALASGVAVAFPGDRKPGDASPGTRLPRVLQDD